MADQDLIKAECEKYIRAFLSADSRLMDGVFHERAFIYGAIAGEDWSGDPKALAQFCDSAPPSAQQDVPPGAITVLALAGNSAAVRVDVQTDAGLSFAEFFVMQKIDGAWRVVGKAFSSL
ncbi:nuclear transport factor 2 family protein [Hyphococcus luteus]|uniref:Nuclear transport factor 2 family protein n=1 Tax=Hyphococcus luteus TaxID=2058213 RepID=A0A2S7K219_9PROT|nr:nuclear transport factor 2 family protein [Marinicaulis flavus]PQA86543.1 hypothetical protein CW354_19675 [Marinicaulis flavus]